MQGPQVDASYGLNPTPQSPIGSERVGMKGEISHPTLKNRGGNDYKPEYTGKRKRQKDAGAVVDLTVPMEDYHECVRLVREYRQAHPLK